ncbi:hypothetical protein IMSAGC013_03524 [Lachnospiraceae bacterium]|nr:hypothetical protein IMSAGC013_03524 [Lachnospiraceae bacterium]
MNLVDFCVTEILEEKSGPVYELYGMTKEQAEAEEPESWRAVLLSQGVKQTYKENCWGAVSVKTKVFAEGEQPYYVGYKGVC